MTYHLTTKKSWDDTIKELAEVFRKWGVRAQDWSTTPQRPHAARNRYQSAAERAVTLTFAKGGRTVTLTMDKQSTAQDNLRVLYLVIDALRLNELRGHAQVYAEAARQLYLPQLPAPGQSADAASAGPGAIDPYAVLFVRRSAPLAVCEAAYKALARQYHPDAGGNASQMAAITVAIDTIRKERQHGGNG